LTSTKKNSTHIEEYSVMMSSKFEKVIKRMPRSAQANLRKLVDDIRLSGPIQSGYRNYSKLGGNTYHCHLAYSWVACWRNEQDRYIVEVYYVGSREKAPY
jgi:mRNA-degrading endonuclease RelE of RelBE toxin-antitoxin system